MINVKQLETEDDAAPEAPGKHTLVLKFGCRRFVEGGEYALAQMGAAHRYYNALIETYRAETAGYLAIRSEHVPGLNEAEAKVEQLRAEREELREQIKALRKTASVKSREPRVVKPTRKVDDDGQRERMKTITEGLKASYARQKELRAQFAAFLEPGDKAFKARTAGAATHKKARLNAEVLAQMLAESEWHPAWKALASLRAELHAKRIALREASALSFGTYLAVEDAAATAATKAKGAPRFQPWDGGRKIGVQLQARRHKGELVRTSAAEVFAGTNGSLQIVERRQAHPNSRGNLARAEYAVARLRLGEQWIAIQVKLHRPIPEDAVISWAYIVPIQRGHRVSYELQLTVNLDRPLVQRAAGTKTGELRFRFTRGEETGHGRGLIVAELDGSSIELPPEIMKGLDYSSAVRGAADTYFEATRAKLIERLKAAPTLPSWLAREDTDEARQETLRYMPQWRAHRKLVWVAERAQEALLPGADIESLWQEWKAFRQPTPRPKPLPPRHLREYKRPARFAGKDLHAPLDVLDAWLQQARPELTEEQRFAVWLEWWRRKDQHLAWLAYRSGERARGARKDFYRRTAARLATEYATIDVHGLDLAKLAKRKPVEKDEDELHQAARRQRTHAALHEFKLALLNALGPKRIRERSGGDEDVEGARETPEPRKSRQIVSSESAAAPT